MKKIIEKWCAFTDKVFEEKANNIICITLLVIAVALIAIQAIRGVGYILIAN
ncbi:hypothetical protein SDC9_62117 [bioreactor metagenome]|uniref:Uncharacterized protein n=1 Tax=bioreactor metagenome TaxID=1076179 RepID=A0A644XHR5_9ZZZZ